MKSVYLLLFFTALFFSCNNRSTPEGVAKKFLKALQNNKYEAAKNFSTGKGIANIELWKLSEANSIAEVKNISCITNGNTAECTFCCSQTLKKITLIKDELSNRWEVNFVVPEAKADTLAKTDSVAIQPQDTVITKKETNLSEDLDDIEAILEE